MRHLKFIGFSILLFACVTASYHSPGPYFGGSLLGRGTYMQDVSIEARNGASFRFQGVFQRRDSGVVITGLSPFGTSVFRVSDSLDPKREARIEIFVKEMEEQRERFVTFYQGLRPLLLLQDKPSEKNAFVRERYPDGRPKVLAQNEGLELVVNEYDWEGHAFKVSIVSPQWTAKISLREFKADE